MNSRSLLISSFICLLFLSLSPSIRSVYAAEVSKVHVPKTCIKGTNRVIHERTVEIICEPEEKFKVVEILLKLDSINRSNSPAGFFNNLKDRVDLDLFYQPIKYTLNGYEIKTLPFFEILGGMKNSILKSNFIDYLCAFQNFTKTSFLVQNNMQSLDIDFDYDSDSYELMRSKLIHYCRFELHKFLLEIASVEVGLLFTDTQGVRIACYQVIMDLLKSDEISEPVYEGCDDVVSRRQYIHSLVARIKQAEKEEEEDILEPPGAAEQQYSRHRSNSDAESDSKEEGGRRVESVLLADNASVSEEEEIILNQYQCSRSDSSDGGIVEVFASSPSLNGKAESLPLNGVDDEVEVDQEIGSVDGGANVDDVVANLDNANEQENNIHDDNVDSDTETAGVGAATDCVDSDSVDAADGDGDADDDAAADSAGGDADNLINLVLDRDLERDHGSDVGADNTSTATIPEDTNVAPIPSEPGTLIKAESLVDTEEDLSSKTVKKNKNTKKQNKNKKNTKKKNKKENKENNDKKKNKNKNKKKTNKNKNKKNNADKKTQAINLLESELRLASELSSDEPSAAEPSSSELSAAANTVDADLSDEGDGDLSGEAPDIKLLDAKQPDIDLSAANEKDAESSPAAAQSSAASETSSASTVIPDPKVAQKSSSVLFLFLIGLISAVLIGALAWALHRHFKASEEEASD